MSEQINGLVSEAKELAIEKRFDECAQTFSEVFEQSPNDPQALQALASVMFDVGQMDVGLALLADSVDQENPDSATLHRIATLLKGQDRLDEAADFLICALYHDQNNTELLEETQALLKQVGREGELELP